MMRMRCIRVCVPIRRDLRDGNLDVVLLLPVRRNLPAVDDESIIASTGKRR
jgi:hypothetical protein